MIILGKRLPNVLKRVNYVMYWGGNMKMTIKDIANIAGVSTATVSKIINKKDSNISDATRNKVQKIIEEHFYVPNRVASSMVTKRTKTLGLVIPNIANPFFPELARGAEDMANSEGYTMILCNTDDNEEKEEMYISMLQEKMVDGIIFTSSSRRTKVSDSLTHLNVPIITVDREIKDLKVSGKIMVDNKQGAYDAVSYMIKRGYRRIIHLTGPMTSKPTQDRIEGYKSALQDNDISFSEEMIFPGDYSSDWGYKAVREALAAVKNFDGVFCGNDLIAIGAVKSLKSLQFIIPEEIGVVGFDDIYMAKMVDPELTTVKQPNYQMGYKSAEMLIRMVEKREVIEKEYILKTKLIIRESTR